jgi:hypothetical protein
MSRLNLNLDGWSKVFLTIAALLTLAQIALVALNASRLPPQIPLFYSLPWGPERLAESRLLWLIPAFSGGVLIINLIGSAALSALVLTRILSSTSFLVAALSLITLGKIIILGLP